MPELPEIESIRQDLSRDIVNKKIKLVSVSNGRSVPRHKSAKEFRDRAEGRTIKSVGRLGKYIVCTLDNADSLVMYVGPSGQFFRTKSAKEAKLKHTHVVITFTQGGELRFVDTVKFGEMFISSPPPVDQPVVVRSTAALALGGEGDLTRKTVPELAHLGFDPMEDQMSWERFAVALRTRSATLKTLLLDQEFVAGVGSVYSDEILYAAGLHYLRSPESLSTTEVRRLFRGLVEILAEAIKQRGSSLSDGVYVDFTGKAGNYQNFHEVYEREGEACRRCRKPNLKVKVASENIYFCDRCQI
ncbi:MAG: bifunctional DNA-formamidopyrimidine glycosylase/DNA-(apurinic or apyrimidinic site) lyase [Actinomycetes bacterium]